MGFWGIFKSKVHDVQGKPNADDITEDAIKPTSFLTNKEELSLGELNAKIMAYREEQEKRLESAYDFNSVEGIESIPVPCVEVNDLDPSSPVGRVDYYLHGVCFARHKDAGEIDMAAACVKKSHELMLNSDIGWPYESYISGISWLHSVGMHDLAKTLEAKVNEHFDIVGFYPPLDRSDFPDDESYSTWKKNVMIAEHERLRKKKLRHEYYWLEEFLPDLCPKSLSGYSRMKNSNSKSYQKIVQEAEKMGKILS